ncbi:ribosomal L1 domain-containing protein CG13096 [Drosophila willistoni]|uniref:ribosomal L1 domain-containing protein CG13096 n=1 Tax=Drosophila willistoni TaxID=7260 RepID=UPI00017D7E09|nr:ribosomal L1 domain-containing protein CG13096 [Drosophila willistoni]
MVKVQKPQPKTLSKGPGKEAGGVTKKTKVDKSKKLNKTEAIKTAALEKKEQKPATKTTKPEKKVAEKQPKASKKPLILAPAVSPTPEKKPKKSKLAADPASVPVAKKPLKLTTVLPEVEKKDATKKQKKTAPATAAAPVKKTAEKSKKPVKEEAPATTATPVKKTAEKSKKPTKEEAPTKKSLKTAAAEAAVEKKNESKKQKKANGPETPAVVKAPAKKATDKPKKVAKAVASVPESTAPTAVKKTGDKTKKPAKAAVPAPSVVKKVEDKKEKKQVKPAAVAPVVAPVAADKKKLTKPETKSKPQKISKSIKPGQSPVKKAGKPKPKSIDNKKAKKSKPKKKEPLELKFELNPYDEQKFQDIVNESNVLKVCEALKTQVETEVKKQKSTSIFSDYRYILQVTSYKIPSCPKRMVKLDLKHSLVGSDDDVAIIVTDLQRGAKFETEPTVQYYEDLLREAGVEQRLTVVPFNQLRNEMGTFEAKRKFLNSYDYLLCDGRLSGQASAFLGKFTQKPRNVLHPVRLSLNKNALQKEISRALRRTAYRQLNKGDLIAIPVGNHEHSTQQLADNIRLVFQKLQSLYPGGLANIRSIFIKIDIAGTSALPLYYSTCAPPADTPYVVGPREQRMLKLKKQANEVLSRFALTKDADFIKLTPDQVKHKAEVRAKRAAVLAGEVAPEEDAEVPAKKARKDSSNEAEEEVESDEEELVEEEDADDDEEDNEEGDDDDVEDDDDEE